MAIPSGQACRATERKSRDRAVKNRPIKTAKFVDMHQKTLAGKRFLIRRIIRALVYTGVCERNPDNSDEVRLRDPNIVLYRKRA